MRHEVIVEREDDAYLSDEGYHADTQALVYVGRRYAFGQERSNRQVVHVSVYYDFRVRVKVHFDDILDLLAMLQILLGV